MMVWRFKLQAVAALAVLMLGLPVAFADERVVPAPAANDVSAVRVDMALGVMTGEARKYIYDFIPGPGKGRTVSELIFTFDDVAVLSGQVTWQVLPWFEVAAGGRINVTGASTFDDFDYDLPFCPPRTDGAPGTLCQSHHENTTVDYAQSFDVSARARVFKGSGWDIGVLGGYRTESNAWSAIGGVTNNGFIPPDELVITYEQRWRAPYAGLDARYAFDRWFLTGRVYGSLWGEGRDDDQHLANLQRFQIDVEHVHMAGAMVTGGYRLSDGIDLTLSYSREAWFVSKGSLKINNFQIFVEDFIPADLEPAGMDLNTETVSAGVRVSF
jgi:outer membrane protease